MGISTDEESEMLRRAEGLGDDSPTFQGLTLYEKKSVLVDRELDQMGMGKYQYLIFFLCGLGYFLDLLWAVVFSLVAGPIQAEMGVNEGDIGWLYASFNAGLMVGAMSWGMAVDIIGRRWCFNLTCLITTVFGALFAVPSSFTSLCVLATGVGVGVGGNIPIDATIVLEFLPKNRRYLLAALSTFQPLGTISAAMIAWAIIPHYSCPVGKELPCPRSINMGWRYTILTIAFITAFIFLSRFSVFRFRESAKYLLSTGHDAHALDVLYAIALFNGAPPPILSLEDFQALEYREWLREGRGKSAETEMELELESKKSGVAWSKEGVMGRYLGHLGGMFRSKVYAYLFGVLVVAYMSLFFSFSIAGGFLPLILAARGVETEMSQSDTYKSYVLIYLPGVTATWTAAIAMDLPRSGRKWAMVSAAGLMGVSLILYQLVNSITANIAFNALEYWCQSLFTALLYAYTPEAFPATYRGSACGMLSTLGRVAGIIAPIIGGKVYTGGDSPGVLYLAGGAAWISMLAIACLPLDDKGKEVF